MSSHTPNVTKVQICLTFYFLANPNPNYKNGNKCGAQNPNPIMLAVIHPKRRGVAATIVGLGCLDTALYLNQH